MAKMRIRDIPTEHYQKLQELAAKNGVSIEEYALRIITDAVSDDVGDGERVLRPTHRRNHEAEPQGT